MLEQVAAVRRFNRLVAQRAGALEEHYLGRARPLGESRVLYEIGDGGSELRELRAFLGLDSGYLSRLVGALEAKGLVRLRASSSDERVRRAELTESGRVEFNEINRRSDELAHGILNPLTAGQRERLVTAMTEVRRLLVVAGIEIEAVDPSGPDARWCLDQYYSELRARFESGFDPAESMSPDHSDLLPPLGIFLVAYSDGKAVACGAVRCVKRETGYIKRMWVDGSVRGLGLGRRILSALESAARDLGCTIAQLETNRALSQAIELYRTSGYDEVPPFNDEAYAHHWFEKRLF